MAQIIQGNNLRLLFADMPPSTMHTSTFAYEQQQQQGYSPYGYQGSAASSYSSRSSAHDPYSGQMQFPSPNPYQHPQQLSQNPPGVGRNEIVMVSDDRVMILRIVGEDLSVQSIPYASDGASVVSMPR
jgi:RHO1 GDP-GTP exchange protein 1/2